MPETKNILTPMKAIRAKCLDCCCGQYKEVAFCPCPDCALYLYRFGKNPARAGIIHKGSFSKKLPSQQGKKAPVPLQPGTDTPETTEDGKAVDER